jgi:DNA-binding response OmpR family regulator/cellulose synthase/poly-beta-1,6-N-acetylglucosamine synthase-like glycosyltransferase
MHSSRTSTSTILVVDDEEHIRKLVSMALRRAGHDVVTATTGHEALARLQEAVPDLIISDVNMPEMDGFSFLAKLRADPQLRSIPLIMLTARSAMQDIEEGLNLGADDYLAKPFEIRILLARVNAKLARPSVPIDQLNIDRRSGLLSQRSFEERLAREIQRVTTAGRPACLACIELDELAGLRQKLGVRAESEIDRQIGALAYDRPSLDELCRDENGVFHMLMPETTPAEAQRRLDAFAQRISAQRFHAAGAHVRLTPTIGYTSIEPGVDGAALQARAAAAQQAAASHLDLQPLRYDATMDALARSRTAKPPPTTNATPLFERLRLPLQIAATFVLTLVVPFFLYWALDTAGYDVTNFVYLILVIAMCLTGLLIWMEGIAALRRIDPPDAAEPHPPASAIIAAYLPNEAATLLDTIDAFLAIDYPGPLQIILAYNTPRDMPIESVLRDLALRDSRFVPLRVAHSTSKAQNVNAALSIVTGEFVGVFDADHMPQPDSFRRAWRWLNHGYDVVQGHCLIRNGAESRVARTVAVEFEAIYAVSHPGRARLHGFGIFGGSNGYWRTDLLRRTRMHGFMLTEDIDSSMRVLEDGCRIASDPHLISRELGPVTLGALWNQRMRWAQGWLQVSTKHLWRALRSPQLTLRQKTGFIHLLGWREIFPWLAPQMFPLIAYWIFRGDALDWLVPIYILTSLFTLSVAPGQALFAFLLAAPEQRRHARWFLEYLVIGSLFYSEWKNLVARVAVLKELMQERAWKVTPRSGR